MLLLPMTTAVFPSNFYPISSSTHITAWAVQGALSSSSKSPLAKLRVVKQSTSFYQLIASIRIFDSKCSDTGSCNNIESHSFIWLRCKILSSKVLWDT